MACRSVPEVGRLRTELALHVLQRDRDGDWDEGHGDRDGEWAGSRGQVQDEGLEIQNEMMVMIKMHDEVGTDFVWLL